MAKIEIYTTPTCPYCQRAKRLLDSKRVIYTELNVATHPEWREDMKQRANGRQSVPQIFVNGQHIGGCDDLYALEARGELEPLLMGAAL